MVDQDEFDQPRNAIETMRGKAKIDDPDPMADNHLLILWDNGAWGFYSQKEFDATCR